MRELCRCGASVHGQEGGRVCVRCGAPCCVACAFSLDASPHCRPCAEAVLEAQGASLGPVPGPASGCPVDDPRRPWVIVVAKDQPDLYGHLLRAFARDDKVDVVLDRRRDIDRNPPGAAERLRTLGAAVVRRPLARPA